MTLHNGVAHLREVGQKALGVQGVAAVDVIEHDSRTDGPLLELTVGAGYDRVPPRVIRCLADHDCGIRAVTPQADWFIVIVI
jgi:hypothetical protein